MYRALAVAAWRTHLQSCLLGELVVLWGKTDGRLVQQALDNREEPNAL
jgi:hypothetical protein